MANDYLTIEDFVKINDVSVKDLGVSNILRKSPLMKALFPISASHGTVNKYLREVAYTQALAGFRTANNGRDVAASNDETVTDTLQILDASFPYDAALADSHNKGKDWCINREAQRHLEAAFFEAEKQFINGQIYGDAAGFTGLGDFLDPNAESVAPILVNALGTVAATSIYFLRTNDSEKDCNVVFGNDGQIVLDDSVKQERLGANGKSYTAYWTPIQGYVGCQIGSSYSVGRLYGVDNGSNKLTDAKIYDVLSLFPSGGMPDYIVMNRRSLKQLRESRTATNATGTPAPNPTEVEGVQIIVTDAIGNAEDYSS